MNRPADKANVTPPPKAPRALGRREDVVLIGLYPDKSRDNELTDRFCTGFLDPDGQKATASKRTGVKTKEEAARGIFRPHHENDGNA